MKRAYFFIIFLVLLSSFSLAHEIKLYDSEYVSGETVQAELVYSNLDISKLSLLDSNQNKITIGFFSYLINDINYIYFNLPPSLNEGNYTLQYKEKKLINGTVSDVIIEKNFDIISGNNSFSISPGFVKLNSKESSLKIKLQHSKGESLDINISNNDDAVSLIRESISLNPGESKFLFVDYVFEDLMEDSKLILSFGSENYEIPLLKEIETIEPQINETQKEKVIKEVVENETVEEDFSKSLIIVNEDAKNLKDSATPDVTIEGAIRLKNIHSSTLHNVRFEVDSSLTDIITLNVSSFKILEPGLIYEQYLWINKEKNVRPGEYTGNINIISDEGASERMFIDITFEAAGKEEKENEELNITDYKPGNISINFNEIKDQTQEEKNKDLIIAIILILFVLIMLVLLWLRLKPKKGIKKLGSYVKELKK